MASFCCRFPKDFEALGHKFLASACCSPQNIYSARLRSYVLCHVLSSNFCTEEAKENISLMLLRMPAGQSSSKGAIQLTDKPLEFANVSQFSLFISPFIFHVLDVGCAGKNVKHGQKLVLVHEEGKTHTCARPWPKIATKCITAAAAA